MLNGVSMIPTNQAIRLGGVTINPNTITGETVIKAGVDQYT